MKNGEQPAYPAADTIHPVTLELFPPLQSGLSKREIFAMHFAAAFCMHPDAHWHCKKQVAENAVEHADALLAELEKTEEKP